MYVHTQTHAPPQTHIHAHTRAVYGLVSTDTVRIITLGKMIRYEYHMSRNSVVLKSEHSLPAKRSAAQCCQTMHKHRMAMYI